MTALPDKGLHRLDEFFRVDGFVDELLGFDDAFFPHLRDSPTEAFSEAVEGAFEGVALGLGIVLFQDSRYPVSMMTGMSLYSSFLRSCLNRENPVFLGIITSRRIRSGMHSSIFLYPSSPSSAVTAS